MKRSVVVAAMVVVLLLAAPAAWAKSTITVNPVGLLFGIASLEYETDLARLGNQTTLGVKGLFWGVKTNDLDLRLSGFGAGVRYYVDGATHDGFYVGGYGTYGVGSGKYLGTETTVSVFGLSGVGGYKWVFGSGLVLDVGAEFSFPVKTTVTKGNGKPEDFANVMGAGVNIGIGFAF